jgi:hypothetical protein
MFLSVCKKKQTGSLHCCTVCHLEHIILLGSIYHCLKFSAANLHFNLVGFVMAVQFEQDVCDNFKKTAETYKKKSIKFNLNKRETGSSFNVDIISLHE